MTRANFIETKHLKGSFQYKTMKKIFLMNGIEILYQKNPSSNIVYLEAGFLTGLFATKIEKRQIPHILEHLILRNFTSKNNEFQKNGKTNNLLTTFSFESTAESFEKTLNEFISLFEIIKRLIFPENTSFSSNLFLKTYRQTFRDNIHH